MLFFIQAVEYISAYNESLPDVMATPEEVDSGLAGLSEDFGFSATLFRISREMSIAPETFCSTWNAREFYHLVLFLSWEAKCQKDYSEMMSAKMQRNNK